MTGSEHDRALPFLSLVLLGLAGAPGSGDHYRALTASICELVVVTSAVTNELFAAHCTDQGGGILYSEAVVLAKKAHARVVEDFQLVLGPAHTTKLHRMSAHLLDDFLLGVTSATGTVRIMRPYTRHLRSLTSLPARGGTSSSSNWC